MDFVSVLLFFTTFGFFFFWWRNKKRLYPPGPGSIPLLGSLPFITTKSGLLDFGQDWEITKHRLSTVWIGPKPIFMINCLNLAKELFDREEFSDRPIVDWVIPYRFNKGAFGIINNSGSQWSNQRSFSLKTLKNFGLGKKSLEESIHFEVAEIIEKKFNSKDDIILRSDFNVPIINILWQLVASERFSLDKDEDANLIKMVGEVFEIGMKTDLCPLFIMKMFPNITKFARIKEIIHYINKFVYRIIEEHEQKLIVENPQDFIDTYLVEAAKDPNKFNKDELVNIIWDFFLAGTETSSTTLKWAVLYLTLHQDVQERCRQELEDKVGGARVYMSDLPSLPYLQATIAEVQRISRVAPYSLLHNTTQPTTIGPFTFPTKSTFMVNIDFIMNDPAYFDNPGKFNPHRFLSTDGRYIKNERLIPFSIGRRYCMGESLARNEIFIFLADLLQQVRFVPPRHHPAPSPDQYIVNITRIPQDFHIAVERLHTDNSD